MYIFFSDDRIPAGPVAQQLYELRSQERINAMDLRLPGRVFVETLEFTPEEGGTPVTGTVVGAGATPNRRARVPRCCRMVAPRAAAWAPWTKRPEP